MAAMASTPDKPSAALRKVASIRPYMTFMVAMNRSRLVPKSRNR